MSGDQATPDRLPAIKGVPDHVREHVESRLRSVEVQTDPFPHFYIEDFFPEEFYQQIIANMPASKAYKKWTDVGKVKVEAYSYRHQFYLTDRWIEGIEDPDVQGFWQGIAQWVHGRAFTRAALSPFDPFVHLRFPGQDSWPETWAETLLLRHRAKYYIGPHTDMPARVMNLLFYLPDTDDAPEHLGTSIYRPKDPDFRCPGTKHHDFDGFVRVKTLPYRRNSMMGFLKTDNSFHGVEPIREEDAEVSARDVIQYMVYDNESGAPKNEKYFR